ncbi:MAG: iron ABC transporter permease [Campylobacteraceae bacterium]|jgi:iron(III) transport system permease protein|nr:iron ABC transporter permease [Campylobacteraceae bacterium]
MTRFVKFRALLPCNGWTLLHTLSCVCVLLPFAALIVGVMTPAGEYWSYIREHMLPTYFFETIALGAGSSIAALVLGVSLAWFVGIYDFWGKRVFEILLILPLAIPPYIAAYAYDGFFGFTGSVQLFFNNLFDIRIHQIFPTLPAMFWAIWIFSITLFPYVYLLTRTFMRHQSGSLFENALLLGGRRRLFWSVALPLLMPSAVSGAILVCLEVLNDFGVVSYYGLNTFTTAIFLSWFGMGDADTGIKLAFILLVMVLLVLLLRKSLQNVKRYRTVSTRESRFTPQKAVGFARIGIPLFCILVLCFSFLIPLAQMVLWLKMSYKSALNAALWEGIQYTLWVALTATFIIMIAATASVNANRLFGSKRRALASEAATIGYGIPSAVLAIGVTLMFVNIDKLSAHLIPSLSMRELSMGSAMLIFAYGVRFFAIGYQAAHMGFMRISSVYTEASRTLGRTVTQTFFRVDLPLVKQALISGAALVFIDIVKELPLGLILRPFNSETLGTTVYRFANNEVLEQTALPSLCIIGVSAIFIILTQQRRGENGVS